MITVITAHYPADPDLRKIGIAKLQEKIKGPAEKNFKRRGTLTNKFKGANNESSRD